MQHSGKWPDWSDLLTVEWIFQQLVLSHAANMTRCMSMAHISTASMHCWSGGFSSLTFINASICELVYSPILHHILLMVLKLIHLEWTAPLNGEMTLNWKSDVAPTNNLIDFIADATDEASA